MQIDDAGGATMTLVDTNSFWVTKWQADIQKALELLHESNCGHTECIGAIGVLMNALPVELQPDWGD